MAEALEKGKAPEVPKIPKIPNQARVEAIRDRAEDFGIAKIDTPTLNALEQAGVTVVQSTLNGERVVLLRVREGSKFIENGKVAGSSVVLRKDIKSITPGANPGEFIVTSPAEDGTEKLGIISIGKVEDEEIEKVFPLGETEWGWKINAFVRPKSAGVNFTLPFGDGKPDRVINPAQLGPDEAEVLNKYFGPGKDGKVLFKPNPDLMKPHEGK